METTNEITDPSPDTLIPQTFDEQILATEKFSQQNGGLNLKSAFLQSPDFISGQSGWKIDKSGDVEFNNGTFRGTLSAASGTLGAITIGTNSWHIDSSGNMWWGNYSTYADALDKVSSAGIYSRLRVINDLAGNGYYYENSGNVTAYGAQIKLLGATNDGIGIRIDNDGTGYGMLIDTTNSCKALYIGSTSSGDLLSLVGTGTGKPLYVSQNTGSATAIDIEQGGQGIGIDLEDTGTGSNPVMKILTSRAGESLFIDRNISGYGIYIDQDAANNSTAYGEVIELNQNGTAACYGLSMNITNAGAGLEYAFDFNGSEKGITAAGNSGFVSNSTGTFTAVGYIRVNVSGNSYYMPYGTIT